MLSILRMKKVNVVSWVCSTLLVWCKAVKVPVTACPPAVRVFGKAVLGKRGQVGGLGDDIAGDYCYLCSYTFVLSYERKFHGERN